ncbi:hypothetical protein D3C83_28780 [compost metagenome]
MEQEVIGGARNLIGKFKPLLYVENDRLEQSKNLIELIWSLDYKLFWHLPPLFNPANFACDPENIYPGIVSINIFGFHKSMTLNVTGFQEVLDSRFHPMSR